MSTAPTWAVCSAKGRCRPTEAWSSSESASVERRKLGLALEQGKDIAPAGWIVQSRVDRSDELEVGPGGVDPLRPGGRVEDPGGGQVGVQAVEPVMGRHAGI